MCVLTLMSYFSNFNHRGYQVYVNEYTSQLRNRRNNLGKAMDYISWLRQQFESTNVSTFKRLVDGPSHVAKSYRSCAINGYVFCTYDSEVGTTTQNSGVCMKALTSFRSSAKDKNLVEEEVTYYGIVKQIIELDYFEFKKILFYCDWVRIEDRKNGCVVDPDTNLVFVNLGRLQKNDSEDNEPFILASEASQVFYCKDITRDNWHAVLDAPKRLNADMDAYEDPLVFDARTADNDLSLALMGDSLEFNEECSTSGQIRHGI